MHVLLLLIAVGLHADRFYLDWAEHGSLNRCEQCGLLARGRTALNVDHLDILPTSQGRDARAQYSSFHGRWTLCLTKRKQRALVTTACNKVSLALGPSRSEVFVPVRHLCVQHWVRSLSDSHGPPPFASSACLAVGQMLRAAARR